MRARLNCATLTGLVGTDSKANRAQLILGRTGNPSLF